MTKVVLVTGAGGFIGRHCLPLLRDRDYEVHAVSRKQTARSVGYNWHAADLLDPGQVDHLVSRVQPTHLLHLAWIATPGEYWTSAANLDWLAAGIGLARAFESNGGSRITVAGTCAEYDWRLGYCVENLTPLHPASIYGTSKVSLHSFLHELSKETNIGLAWGRIFFPFGPGDDERRLLGSVCRSLLVGRSANCSRGHQMRDFIFVKDAAEALVSLLDSDVAGPVNIASGRPRSVREVVRSVAEKLDALDLVRFGSREAGREEAPLVLGSISRLRQELGWLPRHTFDEAIDLTIAWWRSQAGISGGLVDDELRRAG